MSYYYRVTKYNPKNRDSQGRYLRDEWISYDDIGKYEELPTISEYSKIEDKYISAIHEFMMCNNIESLSVFQLEKGPVLVNDANHSVIMKQVFKSVQEGDILSNEQLDALFRLILRNYIWCKFKAPYHMQVHFGYDYYMYVISRRTCANSIANIEKSGLFVEEYKSPYSN